jgi:hypothetical protein
MSKSVDFTGVLLIFFYVFIPNNKLLAYTKVIENTS